MRIWVTISLLASVLAYSLPTTAAPCNAGELPGPLLEKIRHKDYSGAEADAQRAARESPDSRDAQLDLAKVYINSALRSVVNFNFKAMGIDPGKGGTYHEITTEMLEKGSSPSFAVDPGYGAKAENQINQVVARWPESRSLLYCLTKIKFYARDHEQFIKTLQRTAKSFEDSEEEAVGYFLNYAKDYYDNNETRKSADVYEILLKVFPGNAPLLSSLGVTYLNMGKTRQAITLFDRAYEQTPEDEIVVGNIAEVSMLVGDFEKAERFLMIRAKRFPHDSSIYFDLAMNAMHKGSENSLPYWDTYFQKNEQHPDGEQWVHAAQVIRQSIKDDAMTDGDMISLAEQFTERLNAPKYAIAMMSYLQNKDKTDAAYPYQLSHAYDKGRNYDLAESALKETYRRLQKQQSKYMTLSENEILYNLARTTYAQELPAKALGYLDRMKKSEDEEANTGYLYGLVHISLGNFKDAREYLALCAKSSISGNLRDLCRRQLDAL